MAIKFGRIDHTETVVGEATEFHKNQTVTSASNGVSIVHLLQDDRVNNSWNEVPDSPLSISGSHWAFVHCMFYLSGSKKVATSDPGSADKYNYIYEELNRHNLNINAFYNSKFHSSGSAIYIPQQYFGGRIKSGSFQLTARSGSSTNTTKQIIIKDDYNGNLYSTNAHHSQSSATSISSSDNYVGNIFYDLGVAAITETGSWSGSVNYTDIGKTLSSAEQTYKFWELKFNSTSPIFTSEYSVKIPSNQFNNSVNATTRKFYTPSGSITLPAGSDISDYINLRSELTGSGWKPYFNQVSLHRNKQEEALIICNLPRAIKKNDDIDLIISFRLDH
jgi:hypothetical protein